MALSIHLRRRKAIGNRESGQAVVEALFSIPVMLILFLIGFELFAITWNAQFVHVRARYSAIRDANHRACGNGYNGSQVTESSTVQGDPGLWAQSRTRTVRQRAVIVCR